MLTIRFSIPEPNYYVAGAGARRYLSNPRPSKTVSSEDIAAKVKSLKKTPVDKLEIPKL